MIVHWIWLATCSGVRDWVKVELVRHFGDAEGVYYAADFDGVEGLKDEEREEVNKLEEAMDAVLAALKKTTAEETIPEETVPEETVAETTA